MLLEIADAIRNNSLRIKPDKIISVAEALYVDDKRYLEKIFNQKIHQVYQCNEGFLAHTCKYGNLHFNEDFLIIEKQYLDKEKKRFFPIITDLKRTTQPIIRYKLDDIIHEKFDCPCSLKSTAIEMVEGRNDDVLKLINNKGDIVLVFPDFVRRAVVFSDKNIFNYSVTQKEKNLIDLFIEGEDLQYENAKKSIIELLRNLEIEGVKIARSKRLHHVKGTKLRRIKNEYKISN